MDPSKLLLLFVLPVFLVVVFAPDLFGLNSIKLAYRVYLDWRWILLGAAYLVVAALAAMIGASIKPSGSAPGQSSAIIKNGYLDFLAIVTIAAYVLWFRALLLDPRQFVALLQGHTGAIRSQYRTIGGVTTLTQCGIAYVILFLDRLWCQQRPFDRRRYYVYFWLILGLALFRVYTWAERLALIELIVPIGVMYLLYRPMPASRFLRFFVAIGPFAAIGGLLTYFAATEFFRSWVSYQIQERSFWDFVLRRVLTYYYTALNNGAALLTMLDWPTYTFEHLLGWVYRFPGLIGPILRYTVGADFQLTSFLSRYADPEFNNLSGIYTVFVDVGLAGGMVYCIAWGGLAGYSFRSCLQREGIGRLLYPMAFVSVLETLRILYLSSPRAFPALLALVVGQLLFRQLAHRGTRAVVVTRASQHNVVAPRPIWHRLRGTLRRG